MKLLKCCTQYTSKYKKLSSGHRTGKGHFSLQFQRMTWPKNAQTTTHLYICRYSDDNALMAESEEELKSLLMKVKEESEKSGLKLSIQRTKIMAFGPITS